MTTATEHFAALMPDLSVGAAKHIPSLDGLRGVAILLVMLFHMTLLGTVPGVDGVHYTCWLDRIWGNLAGFGWSGVDLFFVLSGFLITGLLFDAKGGAGYFRSFYVRRVLRIFPLYYLVVAFCLLVLPHIHNAKSDKFNSIAGDEIYYWTYLSNYIIAIKHFRHGILDVSWTLAIEEQFYLIWPAVVLLLSRRALMWTCGAMVAISITLRTILFLHDVSPIAIMTITPCRMDSLAMGAWLALAARGPMGFGRLVKNARIIAAVAGGALIAYLIYQGPSWDGSALGQCLGYSLLALFNTSLLCVCLHLNPAHLASVFLNSRLMRQMGRYSYAIYLFNFPIRAVFRDRVYGPAHFYELFDSQMPGQLMFYVMAMGATVLAAWLSWHLFEMHFLRLKRFFPMPKRGAAGAS